ncbi:predicted protein [Methanosarcina acetivorans C2A]|uniref:Uncharacterized protein n=1 Tax=Methanosarcina acetivorans (strain ATCC 35395 / DSM 2834 / JCM 12185 / C2A) TaxID=188937 RepID=Q8TNY6_METAC|nr:predicted protein [Methanosarcina acetivorans C2A]
MYNILYFSYEKFMLSTIIKIVQNSYYCSLGKIIYKCLEILVKGNSNNSNRNKNDKKKSAPLKGTDKT